MNSPMVESDNKLYILRYKLDSLEALRKEFSESQGSYNGVLVMGYDNFLKAAFVGETLGKFIGYIAELRDTIEQERFQPTPFTSIDSILCLGGEDIDEEFKRLVYTYTYTEPEEMNEGIKIPVTNSFIGVIHNKYGPFNSNCHCRGPPNLTIYILIIQTEIGPRLYMGGLLSFILSF